MHRGILYTGLQRAGTTRLYSTLYCDASRFLQSNMQYMYSTPHAVQHFNRTDYSKY